MFRSKETCIICIIASPIHRPLREWQLLKVRWGDFENSREYLYKAKEIEPNNPDCAFYYAGTFNNTDLKKYRELSLEVVNKFPESERGAQSIYWLAERTTDPAEKMQLYEFLKNNFPPNKFSWSSSGMSVYFDLLLELTPDKAALLAQTMVNGLKEEQDKKKWSGLLTLSQNVMQANTFLSQNKPKEAVTLLNKTVLSRWSSSKDLVLLLKAEAMDKSGKTKMAYEELKISFARSPEKKIGDALNKYGAKLDKSEKDIEKDIWYVRDTMSKPATDFKLKRYLTPGSTSLSDFKGKVVLLTYWFPGCGPCRGEFPHFQNVVNKFKGKDLIYLGINIVPEQNDYVIPFLKSSGYSFTPLEDYPNRKKGNLDNHGAAPMNFLIDRNGNLMFSGFRTNEQNEDVLEEMIFSLLNRKSSE